MCKIALTKPIILRPCKLMLGVAFWTCLAAFITACQKQSEQNPGAQPPPPAVNVVTLKTQALELKSTLAGRVTAVRSAEIRPQVTGIITKRFFEEGTQVTHGTQLYQIDSATYRAALASAKGELAIAEANAHAAKLRADRYRQLIKSKAVSQQDLDETEAVWQQARARVQAAAAAVDSAQINLDYTTVRAPIDGTISRSTANEGTLVSAQQATALAVIRQLTPVYVDVSQPAADLIAMNRQGDKLNRQVSLELEDGTPYAEAGELQFSESFVDAGTGTVTTRVRFPNADQQLLPGMFVRATLVSDLMERALLVPQRGVLRSAGGSAKAYLVNADNLVELRDVQVSRAIGDQWLVSSGLHEGDRVIISGLQKIKAGIPVQVTSDVQ